MKKIFIALITTVMFTAVADDHKDLIKELFDNKENRKAEIDQIVCIVDSGIAIQMKKIGELISDMQRSQLNSKQYIGGKLEEANKILSGMASVDFRLKTLYSEQLKMIEELTAQHKALPEGK